MNKERLDKINAERKKKGRAPLTSSQASQSSGSDDQFFINMIVMNSIMNSGSNDCSSYSTPSSSYDSGISGGGSDWGSGGDSGGISGGGDW